MILLIDNYDSFTYNLYQMLPQYGQDVCVIRNDKISLHEIQTLNPSAIILSPGPGHPRDAGICVDVIKTFSGVIPILGVCLGHQAIVTAFGGDIISTGILVHGKASPVMHEGKGLFEKMPMPFMAGRYHSLMADPNTFPKELIIDAIALPNIIMGLHHQEHLTFGVQFHPESILTPEGNRLIENFLTVSGVVRC